MTQQDHPALTSRPRKPFVVRSYEPKDHAAALDVFVAAIRNCPDNKEQTQPHWQRVLDGGIHGDLADIHSAYFVGGGHFWVATTGDKDGDEDEVVGMVGVKADSSSAELARMFIHPKYQRCGIGRLLVNTLEQWVRLQGFQRVWLLTINAHRFYETIGYTFVESKMHAVGVEVGCFEKYMM